MAAFIPGIELSRRFYNEVVRPLLDEHQPGLPHAAALIGSGSEVFGFDTAMSTDHEWGPTVWLFLRDQAADQAAPLHEMLRRRLPHEFAGYAVGFVESAAEPGTRVMQTVPHVGGPIEHRVFVTTVRRFLMNHIAYDLDQPPDAADWLTIPAQKLRELTAGAVHHDGVGELTVVRERFARYPRDVWLYLLASGWRRIAQEEHLMPRAAYAGDELGSSLIGARLVRDIMLLCFIMERQYAPYPKWFGTAFNQLRCAQQLAPILWQVQRAATWQERAAALSAAYVLLAQMHNALGITPPLHENVSNFFDRPFNVIWGDQFAEAIAAQITDRAVQQIAERWLIGGVDQWSDNTDVRSTMAWRSRLRALYT